MDSTNTDINVKLKNMEDRLTRLEESIISIDTSVEAMDKKLTQVVDAILGNPLTKSGGFVEDLKILKDKVRDLEEQINIHKDFRKRMTWTTSIVVGALFIIYHLINLYINMKGV